MLASIGFRVHSGWAALVALGGPTNAPVLLERTRLSLAPSGTQGAVQPYHAAAGIEITEAELFLERFTLETVGFAREGMQIVLGRLKKHGFAPAACGILAASGRKPGSLAEILSSHAMIHTAEGEVFRDAIAKASLALGVPVIRVKERDIWDDGEVPGSHRSAAATSSRCNGKSGQKLAAVAAWIAMVKALKESALT